MKPLIFVFPLVLLSGQAWTQTAIGPALAHSKKEKTNTITVPAINPAEAPISIQWLVPPKKYKHPASEPISEPVSAAVQEINFYEAWDVFQNFGKKGN